MICGIEWGGESFRMASRWGTRANKDKTLVGRQL